MTRNVKNLPAMQEMQEKRVQFLHRDDPLEEEMQPTPEFWPENFHGVRSLRGYIPWGHNESDTTELLSMHTRSGVSTSDFPDFIFPLRSFTFLHHSIIL